MIFQFIEKVKHWAGENKSDLYVAGLIFLVSLASFGLGRLSVLWPEKEPITITGNKEVGIMKQGTTNYGSSNNPNSLFPPPNSSGKYVASKNGTAYHFPWCPGAQRIKEENKIWFDTSEEAESRGYRPAANCEGL